MESTKSSVSTTTTTSAQPEFSLSSASSLSLPPKKRPENRYLATYQAFVPTSEEMKNSGSMSFDEKTADIFPIPYQTKSWLAAIRLAHSIREANERDPIRTENTLRRAMHALNFLSKNDIRAGALTSLDEAIKKGEKAHDFYSNLEALTQYKNLESDLALTSNYRLEFYEFSTERKYTLRSVANPQKDVTIRLYRKNKEDKTHHYDLLIVKN